ncbi:MAG: hypothetical protein ACOXZ9_05275 [Bacteroidales bacterium]|jgi:hypothetical protein
MVLKNFPTLLKNKKRNAQPDTTMTTKLNTDNGLQGQKTEGLLLTAVWRNGGFSASYDSEVVYQNLVLRMKFSDKNRHLRKAAKRIGVLLFSR